MWTDPVLSSAIMETMESTRRSVVCITDVLGSIAVPLSRHLVRGIGDEEPEVRALPSVNTHVKTHEDRHAVNHIYDRIE
jgi:hypothetical protein